VAGNTTANVADADVYIESYVIDNEDWVDGETATKQRILNVSQRTLVNEYPDYTIPDDAIYEFSSSLAVAFNDTNKLQQHGVAGFSITGVASFTFKEGAARELTTFIPKTAFDFINADEENDDLPNISGGRAMKWTVL
jgi:hypothetical protein